MHTDQTDAMKRHTYFIHSSYFLNKWLPNSNRDKRSKVRQNLGESQDFLFYISSFATRLQRTVLFSSAVSQIESTVKASMLDLKNSFSGHKVLLFFAPFENGSATGKRMGCWEYSLFGTQLIIVTKIGLVGGIRCGFSSHRENLPAYNWWPFCF